MVETTVSNGYLIIGNYHVAIAVNIDDSADSHTFRKVVEDEEVEVAAFDLAVVWTSEGV